MYIGEIEAAAGVTCLGSCGQVERWVLNSGSRIFNPWLLCLHGGTGVGPSGSGKVVGKHGRPLPRPTAVCAFLLSCSE